MKTILVPTDFSRHAMHSAYFGLELAHQVGDSVLLLHVVSPAPPAPVLNVSLIDLEAWNGPLYDKKKLDMRFMEDELNEYKREQGFADVRIRHRLVVGQPADAILEVARLEQVQFTVMSTVGASNAWENLMGSVTAEVAQRAEQPLWILPDAVRFGSLRQFAYFADLEGDEVSCINQVVDLGEQLRVAMKVVHVSDPDEEDYSQAEAMIDAFEVSYANDRVTFQNLMYESVGQGIEAYTRQHWPDAIVLAHRNRGLVERLFHKSVIRQLALTTKRPLLIIQKPDL